MTMAESNKLDEPLSEAEYDALEAFFGSNAVPQDCMDLEMLDGFLTSIVSGPEMIQPSEWLPVVWSDSQRSVSPVFADNEQAERILALLLRLQNSIARTLNESPTRFKPLLYRPEDGVKGRESPGESGRREETAPPEASAWCEGYMTGVLLREEASADAQQNSDAEKDDRAHHEQRRPVAVSEIGGREDGRHHRRPDQRTGNKISPVEQCIFRFFRTVSHRWLPEDRHRQSSAGSAHAGSGGCLIRP